MHGMYHFSMEKCGNDKSFYISCQTFLVSFPVQYRARIILRIERKNLIFNVLEFQ
jgi:hypothetical protein